MNLLLHTCCATCLGGVIHQLEGRLAAVLKPRLTCYFYNPNIQPKEEYDQRLSDIKRYCEKMRVKLIIGWYSAEKWFNFVKGFETEPEGGSLTHRSFSEGGQRCLKCYTIRLERTAKAAKSRGFDAFASTLTVSPHKKAEIINPIGRELAQKYGLKFLEADFKKRDGFKCACEVAKSEGFYRQNYCGCVFSQDTRRISRFK